MTHAWLTPHEAAQRLRVSVSTVYRWTNTGNRRGLRLVCVRTGAYGIRYRADWIDRFLLGEQVPAKETKLKPKSTRRRTPRPLANTTRTAVPQLRLIRLR